MPYQKRTSVRTTAFVSLRCTEAERAHIRALASAQGLTMGQYIRTKIPGLADVSHDDVDEALAERIDPSAPRGSACYLKT